MCIPFLYGVDRSLSPKQNVLGKSTQYTVLLNAYMKLNIASLWTYSYSGMGTMHVCQVLVAIPLQPYKAKHTRLILAVEKEDSDSN